MTERKIIKTQYFELNECLEKLGIRENISYGKYLPTEYHEIKIEEEDDDGMIKIRPLEVKDLVALFEMIISQRQKRCCEPLEIKARY